MMDDAKKKAGQHDILVVDDTPASLQLLTQILIGHGYNVRPASDGPLALQSVAAKLPDLILLDVKMPEMDGYEVCRHLKADERSRDIPVLFISALSESGEKVKGFAAGGLDFIGKPFAEEEVLARVGVHLRLRELTERLEEKVRERTAELTEANLNLRQEISERLQAEETLRESEARFRKLLEKIPLPLAHVNKDGAIIFRNERFLQIFGYTEDKVPTLAEWWPKAYPDPQYREWVIATWNAAIARATAENRDIDAIEYQVTCKSGEERIVEISGITLGQEFLATLVDLTARKQAAAEREKLEAALQQAQRMESVGRLAGGVAHDYNNMLGVIFGYAEMALDDLAPSDPLYANLAGILSAAERSREITRQLLAFARKQTIAPKVLDLNETVEGMLKMLRRLIGEDIELAWLPGSGLWPVKVDPSQVDQILANLCVNARDAIGNIGKITIETENCFFATTHSAAPPGVDPEPYVQLAFSDNGCGMDKETLAQIFEPFFTTKMVGQGTGLGLATVYGIVKQNNGFIKVYSEPGLGTTFTIFLPRHAGEIVTIEATSPTPAPKGNKEIVLLVEDEPTLLEMVTRMLEGLNYTPLAANSPDEAVRLAEDHPGEIHLLMTDVVMPEMNGRDLAKLLSPTRPTMRCLFMSGYTANVIAHHGVLDEGVQFIHKPFSKQDLAIKIREVLAQGVRV